MSNSIPFGSDIVAEPIADLRGLEESWTRIGRGLD